MKELTFQPCGPYYTTGCKPVNLMADRNYVRAWPGGCGTAKMGSNYAPTMYVSVSTTGTNTHNLQYVYLKV